MKKTEIVELLKALGILAGDVILLGAGALGKLLRRLANRK